jgi:hypothetical protein
VLSTFFGIAGHDSRPFCLQAGVLTLSATVACYRYVQVIEAVCACQDPIATHLFGFLVGTFRLALLGQEYVNLPLPTSHGRPAQEQQVAAARVA